MKRDPVERKLYEQSAPTYLARLLPQSIWQSSREKVTYNHDRHFHILVGPIHAGASGLRLELLFGLKSEIRNTG